MTLSTEYGEALRGRRILVVDDEFLITVVIEEMLCEAGGEVVSAGTLTAALKIANDDLLSAAVLDVRLGNKTSEAIADVLATRSVPFVFYSGQPLPQCMHNKHPNAKVLMKPVTQDVLMDALLEILRH